MKCGVMECEGMERCLRRLMAQGVDVDALVTDGHIQISSVMARPYRAIQHYYDCWHVKVRSQQI